jgi:hypothetical protein
MAPAGPSPETSPGDRPPDPWVDPRLETPRAAGVAGLAFALLFVASMLLLRNHPSGGSSAAEVRDFYVGKDAGALLAAVKFRHEPVPSAETVVTVHSLAFGFLFIYAMRMAAVFMIVVSTLGTRVGVFPRWLVAGGHLAALVLMLNRSDAESLILVFPAWVAAVSVVILGASRTRTSAGEPLSQAGA